MSRERIVPKGEWQKSGGRKVQTGVETGMGRKLQSESASVSILYPHAELRTSLELTRLESNRDEWE